MAQYFFPIPPEARSLSGFSQWIKHLFLKEPIGAIALIITIATAVLIPTFKGCYYSLIGPSFGANVEIKHPIPANVRYGFTITVENYSDVPILGLKASIKVFPNRGNILIDPSEIAIGTIAPNSISNKMDLAIVRMNPDTVELQIQFEPMNKYSNVKPQLQTIPLVIEGP